MKKDRILTLFMLCTLLFLPFGIFSVAQSNGYVGVEEGDEYQWRIKINMNGLDNVMQNVEGLLTEMETRISQTELFGFESMTIPEAMENISYTLLSYLLPPGWENLNISTFLNETLDHYISKFNLTFLSGEIPDNWQSLNYSAFVDVMIDGLNETLPMGWEDQPIPFMLELALNELNNTLLMGILPSGWDDMTLQEFLETIIIQSFPAATESFLTYVMMEQLLPMAYMMLPPGFDTYTIDEFFPLMIPSAIWDANLTYMLDGLWYMINDTSPPGWESEPISNLMGGLTDFLNYTLTSYDPELEGANMTTIIQWGIDTAFAYSNISDSLPVGWDNTTIQELVIAQLEQTKTQWTTTILPQWELMMEMMETVGGFPTTIGIKIAIDQIHPEIQSTLGGQRATPIDMTLSISMDMQTWTSLNDLFSEFNSFSLSASTYEESSITLILETILNFTMAGYIVDPSTYSNQKIAFYDQFVFTQGLIVANNYNWETITTEAIIATTGNPDAYELSADWNSNGLLNRARVSSDGLVAISINLYSGEGEIPGYEIVTLLIVLPSTIVGVIYYIRKRKK